MTAPVTRIRPLGSLRTRSRKGFHSWPICAASAKEQEVQSITDEPSTTASPENSHATDTKTTNRNSPLKSTSANNNFISNRQKVLEARGVSVIYQQSATATFRAAKTKPALPSQGSRVMSATERHRQKRQSARMQQSLDARNVAATKTNPSALKLPLDYEYTVKKRVLNDESAPEASVESGVDKKDRKGFVRLGATTIALVGVSSAAYIIYFVPM